MTRLLRRALTTVFVAAFCVTTPLVVLSTSGYKYNWRKHRVEKTGIIQVDTRPEKAAIVLNGERQPFVTPYGFARLLPEDYVIRFEKAGYFPWEKQLGVQSGQTSFATAQLIRDSLPELKSAGNVTAAAFTRDARGAALLVDDGKTATLQVRRADRTDAVTIATYPTGAGANVTLGWAPDDLHLLVTTKGSAAGPLVLDALVAAKPVDLTAATGAKVSAAAWNEDGSRAVAVTAKGLFAVDPATGAKQLLVPGANVRDAIVRGRTAFVLRTGAEGTTLDRITVANGADEASDARTLASFASGQFTFLHEAGPYLLVVERGRGRLLVYDENGAKIDEVNGTHAQWLAGAREPRLLAWNDFEITASAVRTGEHQLVTRLGTAIIDAAWHPSGDVIFYSTPDGVTALDLDPREPKNAYELVRFPTLGDFAVDAGAGVLRFTGAIGNGKGLYERAY